MNATMYSTLVRERIDEAVVTPVPRASVIRGLPEPAQFNLVHIITGMRRCGKTFYLFQLMRQLLDSGVPRERMFYFDFSDVRLKPMDPDTLYAIVTEYWRQVPVARERGCYLFLDEVQEAPDWQGYCQLIAEHERVTLVITGSSSKVSSAEIASNFRGRSHVHEMWPLSFAEYCRFHDLPLPEAGQDAFSPQTITRYESAYDEYLIKGGFPGVQTARTEDRIEILQGYVRDVIARDITERAGQRDASLAMQLALFALRDTACELSTNELVGRLVDTGHKAYWGKVDTLLKLLAGTYLIHFLPEYSTGLKPDSSTVPKVYAEDPGLVYAVSRANQQDIGKRFETAVYLELRRRNAGRRTDTITSLTARTSRREKVDFLVGDALGAEPYALYQVCADMSAPKTRSREVTSLEAGMRTVGLEEGTVVTLREDSVIESAAGRIRAVPAWKWSLLGECAENTGDALG